MLINFLLEIKKILLRLLNNKFLYCLNNNAKPISNLYGLDRGDAIDRYYIEKFLENNKNDIQGNCLELLNNHYTLKYGHDVKISDILDIDEQNTTATIHGDIKSLINIQDNKYDCIILTQVLQFIDDYDSAIKECYRILNPNGVLLATLPSVSRIDCISGEESDYWRFTKASAKYIFTKYFDSEKTTINSYGNAVSSSKFLLGFSQQEISKKQLEYQDPNFPLIITVRVCKK